MQAWFTKKLPPIEGLVGLEAGPDGLAMAYAVTDNEVMDKPQLRCCAFATAMDESEHPQILRSFVQEHDLVGANCSVVLHSSLYQLLLLEAPDVPAEEMKDAVRWRIKDLINDNPADVEIDIFILPDDAYRGRVKMLYAVVANKEVIHRVEKLVNDSGLKLAIIDVPELALSNVAALYAEDQAGVAFVRIGNEGGMINLSQKGFLYLTRNIDVAMPQAQLTMDTMDELENTEKQQRFDALVLELQRSMDYYESQLGKPAANHLLFSPLTIDTDEVVNYLDANLASKVRAIDINEVIDVLEPVSSEQQAHCLAAIGAAIRPL